MNKLYSLMLGLVLPVAALAQQEVATVLLSSFPIPISSLENISPAIDEAGNMCLYLDFKQANIINSAQFLTLSPEGQVLSKSTFQSEILNKPELLGALIQPKHFLFYQYSKLGSTYKIEPFLIDKATGATIPLPSLQPKLYKGSKLVTSFVEQNEVYMLFYTKKENTLQVVRLNADNKLSVHTIATDIDNGPSRFLRYGDVVYMDQKLSKTVFAGHHQKKVYLQHDKLYIVFDAFAYKATTEILELNLTKNTSRLTKLHKLQGDQASEFNSYLFKDRVFRLQLSNSYLSLTVYDVNTQEQLKNYLYWKEDDLALKSTPVIKRGAATIYESDYKVLEKTTQVLRKMDKGKPAITVEDVGQNTLQLTIGSYMPPNTGISGGMMMPTGGGTISTPNGTVTLPTTWMHMGGAGFYSHGTGVSVHFKAFVDADTYEKVEHVGLESLQDQVDEYEEELHRRSIKTGAKAIYRANGKGYFIYEDKNGQTLKLVLLSEASPQ